MPYDMTDGGAAAYHRLQIEGREELHIGKLSLDGGEMQVDGRIDAVTYEDTEVRQGSFLSRLFG